MFIKMLLLSLSSPPSSLPIFVIAPNFFENLIKSTIALFVVIDPVGNVPLFIALTEKMELIERKAVSKIAVITAAALLTVFAIAGSEILTIFGITIYSFMVAGGILLFIVSIELLTHVYGDLVLEQEEKQQASQEWFHWPSLYLLVQEPLLQ
jgi:MarC family membrane protein